MGKEGKPHGNKLSPSKDNASKEEKVVARKQCSSLQDDPAKSETFAQ
jgi:hypothetical protein